MTDGELIERLTRQEEQRKILAMLKEKGDGETVKYLEDQLKK